MILKARAAQSVQRLLLKLLAFTVGRGVRPHKADVVPLLKDLVEAQPELASSLAARLAQDGADKGLQLLRGLLNDAGSVANTPEDIDRLINFSAYWRDEWVAQKAATLSAGARVLDAGAGQCQYKSLFAHTKYHAQDFAQYEGTEQGPLQETWNYASLDYVCDIAQIPVEDGAFDAVLCTEVLEHVPDPISALRELCRVTREGGSLFLSAPLGSGIHQEPYHFYGGFSPYFYQKYLADFGCEVVEIKPLGGLFRHVAQEVHRAARTMEEAPDAMSPERRYVMMDWLPRLLSEMDARCFVEQFTVGYLVEARKRVNDTAS